MTGVDNVSRRAIVMDMQAIFDASLAPAKCKSATLRAARMRISFRVDAIAWLNRRPCRPVTR